MRSLSHPFIATLVTLNCLLTANMSHAQRAGNYPNKPIAIVTNGAAGGSSDFINRIVAAKLGEQLGQQIVVENITAGRGVVAAQRVAKAPPNGYTLLGVTSSSVVTSAVTPEIFPVSFRTSYMPITNFVTQPYVMVVNAALPVKSVRELVALAKSKPGVLNFASLGTGSTAHLGMELFRSLAGIDIHHIPYKGTDQAEFSLVTGESNILLGGSASSGPFMKSGKTRGLAVTSSKRSKIFPDLPTLVELGYPEIEVEAWFGLMATGGTPADIVQTLHTESVRVLNLPDVLEKILARGVDVAPSDSPADFGRRIARELDTWEGVMKKSGIKL